jgi:hypothetical protein
MKLAGIIVLVIGKLSLILGVAKWSDPKYSDTFFFINIAIGFACLLLGDYLLNRNFRIKEDEIKKEKEKEVAQKINQNHLNQYT